MIFWFVTTVLFDGFYQSLEEHAVFIFRVPEVGDGMFLQNVGNHLLAHTDS
jgi:hypothetical protein